MASLVESKILPRLLAPVRWFLQTNGQAVDVNESKLDKHLVHLLPCAVSRLGTPRDLAVTASHLQHARGAVRRAQKERFGLEGMRAPSTAKPPMPERMQRAGGDSKHPSRRVCSPQY